MPQDNMLQAPHDRSGFNPNDELPKHTVYSSGVKSGIAGLASSELQRGYMDVVDKRTDVFDPDKYGGTTSEGNPLTVGGFLSRPRGTAR